MAHKKATGSKASQGGNVAGKRLGVKVFGGQPIKEGSIILKQIGTKVHPGINAGLGRDFTIFAKRDGVVSFKKRRNRQYVEVISS